MNPDQYVKALRRDAETLASSAEGNLDAEVPSCPEWKVRDLVAHTAKVHRFWSEIVDRRLRDPHEVTREEAPDDARLVEWFKLGATRLADVLESADPTIGVWTWAAHKKVGFVQRRMAHETAIHRWDAQNASGRPAPIDAAVAADGVDEMLHVFVPAVESPLTGRGESLHLHQTDGDGEWVVRLSPGGVEVGTGHEKGDAAVRASASELDLLLWRRIRPEDVEVFGDQAVLNRLLSWLDLD